MAVTTLLDRARGPVKEALAIPGLAARVLARHFPVLVIIICLGLAGRQAIIWLAVWASNFGGLWPTLLLPLAPLCVMTSLIAALWSVRPSLPYLAQAFPAPEGRALTRTRLLSIGGLLIPFLTVYVTHGLLKEDLAQYRRATTIDEFMNQGFGADFSRVFIDNTVLLIALVAVTLVVRKIIGYFALGERTVGLASLAAYTEVLWMSTASVVLTNGLGSIREWTTTRAVIAPSYTEYLRFKNSLSGPWMEPWNWLTAQLPKLGDMVAVPIAWLTLGAVIFGTTLLPDAAATPAPSAAAAETKRNRWGKVVSVTKSEARQAFDNAVQPVVGPIKTTWKNLRILGRAGLLPMMLFCLVFILATAVELGFIHTGRAIFGPQGLLAAEVVSTYVRITARAAYLITAMCLLAAALNYFLERTRSNASPATV